MSDVSESLKKYTRPTDLPTDFSQRRTMILGDPVYVTILRSGYWHDKKLGRFAGYTRSGRIRVFSHMWNGTRVFNEENVTRRS